VKDADKPTDMRESLRRVFVGIAITTGALGLCVAVLLAANYVRANIADPMDSPELQRLRREVHSRGEDPDARELFRALDLRVRREYFRNQRFARIGGYLLMGFTTLCAGSCLAGSLLAKKITGPKGAVDFAQAQTRVGSLSRWSVLSLGILLAAGAAVWSLNYRDVLTPQAMLTEAPLTDEPYQLSEEEVTAKWTRFRGPEGGGVSPYKDVPDEWDGKTGRNIAWKSFIPLPGQNSPVVWADRVFLTGADRTAREVYCYSAATGELLWTGKPKVPQTPNEAPEVSDETGYAAPTAVTDGRGVYAIFANGDLVAFDFAGNQMWARALGLPENMYGHASSLAMYRHLLLVQLDQGDEEDNLSKVLAIDPANGRIVWSASRPVATSWASPIVIDASGTPQLITAAAPWVIAYDPASGREIWKARCLEGDVAPSPIYAGGLVFAIAPSMSISAIRTDGTGDVTKTHISWECEDGIGDIASPVSDGTLVWVLTTSGLLTCYEAKDGTVLYDHEFDGIFFSSPSVASRRLYITDIKGVTYIATAAREFRMLGKCELGEETTCCPAFTERRIYIRGIDNLYCIAAGTK